jgi:hypothetical protein
MQCQVCSIVSLRSSGEGGIQSGIYSRIRTCVRQMTGGGKVHVRVVRGIGEGCGQRIWIRLVELITFHVEIILIRVTV